MNCEGQIARRFVVFVAFLLLVYWPLNGASLGVSKINTSDLTYPYRSDFCGSLRLVANGSISDITKTLKGKTIKLGFEGKTDSLSLFYLTFNTTTYKPTGGYLYSVWNLLATTGGFTVKWVYAPRSPSSLSNAKYLVKVTPQMDFYGGMQFSDTNDRRLLGLGFTSTVVDMSLYVLVKQQSSGKSFDLFGFIKPFSTRVWGLIVATLFFNAAVFWMMRKRPSSLKGHVEDTIAEENEELQQIDDIIDDKEFLQFGGRDVVNSQKVGGGSSYVRPSSKRGSRSSGVAKNSSNSRRSSSSSHRSKEEDLAESIESYIYHSLATFVGGETFTPDSTHLRLLQLGFMFLVLILISSYTANLASALISQSTLTSSITSIDDAVTKRATACVDSSSAAVDVLNTYYPSIRQKGYANPYHVLGVSKGECDFPLVTMASWEISQGMSNINPNCDLAIVGSVVRTISGACTFYSDYNKRCTSFLNDAIAALLLLLRANGKIEEAWNAAIRSSSTQTCAVDSTSTSDVKALDIFEMAGIFVVYGAFVVLAFLVYIFQLVWAFVQKRMKKLKRSPSSSVVGSSSRYAHGGEEGLDLDHPPGIVVGDADTDNNDYMVETAVPESGAADDNFEPSSSTKSLISGRVFKEGWRSVRLSSSYARSSKKRGNVSASPWYRGESRRSFAASQSSRSSAVPPLPTAAVVNSVRKPAMEDFC